MTNVITEPTRQQAILDTIIISENLPFLVPDNTSDHKATYITLPIQYDTEGAFNGLIYLYKNANFTLLKQKLSNYDGTCLREELQTKFVLSLLIYFLTLLNLVSHQKMFLLDTINHGMILK